eukprot:4828777-Lingulodinium_polyedra.AAC.1
MAVFSFCRDWKPRPSQSLQCIASVAAARSRTFCRWRPGPVFRPVSGPPEAAREAVAGARARSRRSWRPSCAGSLPSSSCLGR